MTNKQEFYVLYDRNEDKAIWSTTDLEKAVKKAQDLSRAAGLVRVIHLDKTIAYFFRGIELVEHPAPKSVSIKSIMKLWTDRLRDMSLAFMMVQGRVSTDITQDIGRLVTLLGRLDETNNELNNQVVELKLTNLDAPVKKYRVLYWKSGIFWVLAKWGDSEPMEYDDFEDAVENAIRASIITKSVYTIQNTRNPDFGIGVASGGEYRDTETPKLKGFITQSD